MNHMYSCMSLSVPIITNNKTIVRITFHQHIWINHRVFKKLLEANNVDESQPTTFSTVL